jgi:hypothetical protein
MDINGNIEEHNETANCDTFFKLSISDNNTAKLRPQDAQTAFLIKYHKSLLKPIFELTDTDAPATYELRGNVWWIKEKRKIQSR